MGNYLKLFCPEVRSKSKRSSRCPCFVVVVDVVVKSCKRLSFKEMHLKFSSQFSFSNIVLK